MTQLEKVSTCMGGIDDLRQQTKELIGRIRSPEMQKFWSLASCSQVCNQKCPGYTRDECTKNGGEYERISDLKNQLKNANPAEIQNYNQQIWEVLKNCPEHPVIH